MPTFFASNPIMAIPVRLELDFDVDARGQIELHQRVDRLRCGLHDVDETLVHPDLELLTRLLVDVRRTEHGIYGALRGGRDRSRSPCSGSLRRAPDLPRRLVEHGVVVRAQADADALPWSGSSHHSVTSATTPAPTVRPPSRMGKGSSFPIAFGLTS